MIAKLQIFGQLPWDSTEGRGVQAAEDNQPAQPTQVVTCVYILVMLSSKIMLHLRSHVSPEGYAPEDHIPSLRSLGMWQDHKVVEPMGKN